MKKLAVILVISICSFVTVVSAQVSVFSKLSLESGKIAPTVTICGSRPISNKVGFTYFGLVNQNWAEAQLGASYSPASFVQFGLSCGLEQNPSLFRAGGSLWFGINKTSFLALAEKGSGFENYWYKITLSQKISEKISLGIRAWRYNGIGPLFEFKHKSLKFWAMPTTSFLKDGGRNVMFGLDVKI